MDTMACIPVGDASIAVTSVANNLRIDIGEKWVSDLSAPPSFLSRYRAGRPWRGLPQFPQAICQSRGPARTGRNDFIISAISASDMPRAGGLARRARHKELREDKSWRPGILSHHIQVRITTSGAAASSLSERGRCEKVSRRTSMMPVLYRRGSADIRHNIAQERQGRVGNTSCTT